MKLRNKKTGEIGELMGSERSCPYITIDIDFQNGNPIAFDYTSLAELNADWEDYKPKAPLIKDEKIRKAVRAWAEANEAIEFSLRYDNKRISFYSARADSVIEFATDVDILSEHGCFYTITELCGEEEE